MLDWNKMLIFVLRKREVLRMKNKDTQEGYIPPFTVSAEAITMIYKALKRSENKESEADADLASVTKLYDKIVEFIESIEKDYGYKPQIIISDHADNLSLSQGDFNFYARKRWRGENEGFIDMSLVNSANQDNNNTINDVGNK